MNEVLQILKKNSLSVTEGRKKILELFIASEGALAHADIEKQTSNNFDRVTVYRTLQTFVEKGIIHQIPTTDNSVLYALCRHNCEQGHHHDNHVHFICSNCDKTICLDDVTVPQVKLPEGFTPLQSAMVVTGICLDCA
ncbi:MAG TPA: Fur family transcriptional regulator [Chitinophagaceae bacterium]|nr:Fur family transcriptional regulator [Chitinophagaceae bacterium]HRF26100.1 transcriptional repressor [Ferruginibacter sp.]